MRKHPRLARNRLSNPPSVSVFARSAGGPGARFQDTRRRLQFSRSRGKETMYFGYASSRLISSTELVSTIPINLSIIIQDSCSGVLKTMIELPLFSVSLCCSP